MKEVKHIRYISIINACKKFIPKLKENHKNKFLIFHYWMTLGEYKYYRRIGHINRDMVIAIPLKNITKGNELYEEESKA